MESNQRLNLSFRTTTMYDKGQLFTGKYPINLPISFHSVSHKISIFEEDKKNNQFSTGRAKNWILYLSGVGRYCSMHTLTPYTNQEYITHIHTMHHHHELLYTNNWQFNEFPGKIHMPSPISNENRCTKPLGNLLFDYYFFFGLQYNTHYQMSKCERILFVSEWFFFIRFYFSHLINFNSDSMQLILSLEETQFPFLLICNFSSAFFSFVDDNFGMEVDCF